MSTTLFSHNFALSTFVPLSDPLALSLDVPNWNNLKSPVIASEARQSHSYLSGSQLKNRDIATGNIPRGLPRFARNDTIHFIPRPSEPANDRPSSFHEQAASLMGIFGLGFNPDYLAADIVYQLPPIWLGLSAISLLVPIGISYASEIIQVLKHAKGNDILKSFPKFRDHVHLSKRGMRVAFILSAMGFIHASAFYGPLVGSPERQAYRQMIQAQHRADYYYIHPHDGKALESARALSEKLFTDMQATFNKVSQEQPEAAIRFYRDAILDDDIPEHYRGTDCYLRILKALLAIPSESTTNALIEIYLSGELEDHNVYITKDEKIELQDWLKQELDKKDFTTDETFAFIMDQIKSANLEDWKHWQRLEYCISKIPLNYKPHEIYQALNRVAPNKTITFLYKAATAPDFETYKRIYQEPLEIDIATSYLFVLAYTENHEVSLKEIAEIIHNEELHITFRYAAYGYYLKHGGDLFELGTLDHKFDPFGIASINTYLGTDAKTYWGSFTLSKNNLTSILNWHDFNDKEAKAQAVKNYMQSIPEETQKDHLQELLTELIQNNHADIIHYFLVHYPDYDDFIISLINNPTTDKGDIFRVFADKIPQADLVKYLLDPNIGSKNRVYYNCLPNLSNYSKDELIQGLIEQKNTNQLEHLTEQSADKFNDEQNKLIAHYVLAHSNSVYARTKSLEAFSTDLTQKDISALTRIAKNREEENSVRKIAFKILAQNNTWQHLRYLLTDSREDDEFKVYLNNILSECEKETGKE